MSCISTTNIRSKAHLKLAILRPVHLSSYHYPKVCTGTGIPMAVWGNVDVNSYPHFFAICGCKITLASKMRSTSIVDVCSFMCQFCCASSTFASQWFSQIHYLQDNTLTRKCFENIILVHCRCGVGKAYRDQHTGKGDLESKLLSQ